MSTPAKPVEERERADAEKRLLQLRRRLGNLPDLEHVEDDDCQHTLDLPKPQLGARADRGAEKDAASRCYSGVQSGVLPVGDRRSMLVEGGQ